MLRFLFLRYLSLALFSLPLLTSTHGQGTDPGIIPGRILFMLNAGGNAHEVAGDLRVLDGVTTNAVILHEVSAPMRIWEMEFEHQLIPQQKMLDAVNRHPQVTMAQNDHPVTFRQVPNDPEYPLQWHHQNIDSELAWDVTTGGVTADGDSIVVCVIEGANMLHNDLIDNRWLNHAEIPNNGIDDDGNGYVDDYRGWNPGANNDVVYSGSHGTSVAGMVGAKGNNGIGVAGANWNVKIMIVTVGSLSQSNVIASYTYPLVMRRQYNATNGALGAFVVATNASWGIDYANPANYPLWCAVYDTLGTAGILNCGATANNNVNIDAVGDMPTACPSDFMVSVTATNDLDNRTFSGYGLTTIDVGAPGANVRTTAGTGGGTYTTTSGTSFASPLTAGVIGLLYAAPCPSLMALAKSDPQAGALYVRQKLFDGVDQVGNLSGQTVTGGRINANNSMQLIVTECGGCIPPAGLAVQETSPTAVTLSWNGSADDVFNLRYRAEGAAQWINVNNLSSTSHALSGLAACGSYEFQVQRICDANETSSFSTSGTWTLSGCCTPVTVVVNTDRYGAETTWSITNGSTVFASGGPYTSMGSNGVYPQPSVELCLPDGCYDLVVNDSWGDGMCCTYGAGSITVVNGQNEVLASAASFTFQAISPFCVSSSVQADLKVWLQGPYGTGPLMSDALRANGLLPLQEPYTGLGWSGPGGETTSSGVLAVTGNNAVVDWIRVELRSPTHPATVVAARHGLLQRDGDIVDVDGVTPISFEVAPGDYHIAVRHRNHLGCMTAAPITLSNVAAVIDLRAGSTPTWGSDARHSSGSIRALWAGDANPDHTLKYTGAGNDRSAILNTVGALTYLTGAVGYHLSDVNMNGIVTYTGSGNDRSVVLSSVGAGTYLVPRVEQVP